jgi:hypothetical protein
MTAWSWSSIDRVKLCLPGHRTRRSLTHPAGVPALQAPDDRGASYRARLHLEVPPFCLGQLRHGPVHEVGRVTAPGGRNLHIDPVRSRRPKFRVRLKQIVWIGSFKHGYDPPHPYLPRAFASPDNLIVPIAFNHTGVIQLLSKLFQSIVVIQLGPFRNAGGLFDSLGRRQNWN